METPKYVNELEVATITGLPRSTIRKNRYVGKGIVYAKVDGLIRYDLADVLHYMESHKVDLSKNKGDEEDPECYDISEAFLILANRILQDWLPYNFSGGTGFNCESEKSSSGELFNATFDIMRQEKSDDKNHDGDVVLFYAKITRLNQGEVS
ncbi:MAG: helix-turn-helix domain-containing protein [Desulfovibrionaceae bacterium]|nr:helix-turn-helix domain-containing protein [Desulfovibrionaceae bacterium]